MEENYTDYIEENDFKSLSVINTYMTSDMILRLSPRRMIALTDGRSSTSIDNADIASKMIVKGKYVALIAGRAGATQEMIRDWNDYQPIGNFSKELEILTNSFHKIYEKTWVSEKLKPHGIEDSEEYETGNLKNGKPISVDLLRKLQNETEEYVKPDSSGSSRFSSYIIYGGQDEERKDMEIYEISGAGNCEFISDHFCTGGIGSLISRLELGEFIETLPPEKRDDIDFVKGLHKSLVALAKSEKAHGVGGIPTVADIGTDGVKIYDSKVSRVMRNVVVKELKGFLEKDKAESYLEGLANGKIEVSIVENEIYNPKDLENFNLSM